MMMMMMMIDDEDNDNYDLIKYNILLVSRDYCKGKNF